MADEQIPQNDQGSFFQEEIHQTGGTEPAHHGHEVSLTPNPEGVYPDHSEPEPETVSPEKQALLDSVRESVKKQKNRAAQTGHHSARNPETGLYDFDLAKPGSVVPGWGIVYNLNDSEQAKLRSHIDELNRRIRSGEL